MFSTALVFHAARLELKAEAKENIADMSVAELVSHSARSEVKVEHA